MTDNNIMTFINIRIDKYQDNTVNNDVLDVKMKKMLTDHLAKYQLKKKDNIYIYESEVLKALIYIDDALNPDFKFENNKFTHVSYFQIFYIKMVNKETVATNDFFIDFVKSLTKPSDDDAHKMTFIICSGNNELSGITSPNNPDYKFSKIDSDAENTKIDQLFSLPNKSKLNYIVITVEPALNQLKESKQEGPVVVSEQPEKQSQQQAEGQLVVSEQPQQQPEKQSQQQAEGQLVVSEQPEKQAEEEQLVVSEQPQQQAEDAEKKAQKEAEEARIKEEEQAKEELLTREQFQDMVESAKPLSVKDRIKITQNKNTQNKNSKGGKRRTKKNKGKKVRK